MVIVHIKKASLSHTGSLLLWRTPENLSQVTSYSSKNRHRVERKCCFLKRHKGHFKLLKINSHNHAQNHVFFLPHYFVQFSSVTQSCLTLCNPMDCSIPGFPVHHQLSPFASTKLKLGLLPGPFLWIVLKYQFFFLSIDKFVKNYTLVFFCGLLFSF